MPSPKKNAPQQETHSGYNEKNPAQPQGAFTPDNTTSSENSIKEKVTRGKKASAKKARQ